MIFLRRDRAVSTRYVWVRVLMLFLAAAFFFAGVRSGEDTFTTIAMAVAIVAIIIGVAGRRGSHPVEEED